ncbi:TPA: hypothetical protein ACIO89_004643, partial [Salmonella enterica subsp. enterica serovar Java]
LSLKSCDFHNVINFTSSFYLIWSHGCLMMHIRMRSIVIENYQFAVPATRLHIDSLENYN